MKAESFEALNDREKRWNLERPLNDLSNVLHRSVSVAGISGIRAKGSHPGITDAKIRERFVFELNFA